MISKVYVFIFSAILITIGSAFGQNPIINFSFTGVFNGQHIHLDSIKINNTIRNCDTTLYWPDTILSVNTLGIKYLPSFNEGLIVFQNFPNPVENQTSVKIFIPISDFIQIKISDYTGKTTTVFNQKLVKGYHRFLFTPGNNKIYLLTATYRSESKTIKIVKGEKISSSEVFLTYIGQDLEEHEKKSVSNIERFLFSLGDNLELTGYYDNLTSTIIDSPGTSKPYQFVFSQIIVESINSGLTNNLFSVSSFENTYFIAGAGVLLKSVDFGETWNVIYNNPTILFYGIEFSDINTGYAVGLLNADLGLNALIKIFKTIDGGVSWMLMPEPRDPQIGYLSGIQKTYSALDYRLGGISLISNNRFICGAGSSTYYSSTAGRSLQWDDQVTETSCIYYLDENRAFKGGKDLSFGQAGGTTFGSLHEGVIFDIDFVEGNIGYALEECDGYGYARIYKINANQSYGETPVLSSWSSTPKILTEHFSFLGLDFINEQEGVIVGENGMVFRTTDGNEYSLIITGTSEQLNKIHFINSGIAVIVGNNGKILRINFNRTGDVEDGRNIFIEGNHWDKTTPSQYAQKDFYKVHIQNSKVYALGDGIVLTSNDGGINWSPLITTANRQFRNIIFADNNVGWIGAITGNPQIGETYYLYKTINGGNTWTFIEQFTIAPHGIFQYNNEMVPSHFVLKDAANIKIVTPTAIFYTSNGGNTWQTGDNYGIVFSDIIKVENNRWFGGTFTQAEAYSFDYDMQSFGLVSGLIGAAPTDAVKRFGSNSLFINSENQVFMTMDKTYSFLGATVYHTYGRFFSDTYPFPYFRLTNTYSYIPLDAYGVSSPGYDIVYYVGEKGFIAKSTTGGDWPTFGIYPMPHKTWYGEESGVYSNLRGIAMFDQEHGVAVGDQGVILVRN